MIYILYSTDVHVLIEQILDVYKILTLSYQYTVLFQSAIVSAVCEGKRPDSYYWYIHIYLMYIH